MPRKPGYALSADGSTVQIRPAGPADLGGVRAMHEAMSPDSMYLRFFSISPLAAHQEASRVWRETARAQLAQVIGNQVLRLSGRRRQLADPSVAKR
jgi:hypothetical protein